MSRREAWRFLSDACFHYAGALQAASDIDLIARRHEPAQVEAWRRDVAETIAATWWLVEQGLVAYAEAS